MERGIPLRDGTHAISLYADDLLLYLGDGERGLEEMIEDMQDFGELSGLKLNMGKYGLFPINKDNMTRPAQLGGLSWYPCTFK